MSDDGSRCMYKMRSLGAEERDTDMWLVKRFFHDKRCTVGLLLLWMVTVCSIFYVLGAFHMGYMHIGPSEETVFMGLKIDNWGKWMALAIFSFCNTGINEFISNALDPWFVNSLQVSLYASNR